MPLSPQPPVAVPTQCLNYVWLGLRFAASGQAYRDPIPPEYIENIVRTALNNRSVDVHLWIDPKRLTGHQLIFLQDIASNCPSENLTISSLRSIAEYDRERLFQQEDKSSDWRRNKHSLIWRQVDVARILVCLHSMADYGQIFYSDMDITNFDASSDAIQPPVTKHGLVLSGNVNPRSDWVTFENQMFGFNPGRHDFLEKLYSETIKEATGDKPINGYGPLGRLLYMYMVIGEGLSLKDIVFKPQYNNIKAYQPGSEERHTRILAPIRLISLKIRDFACAITTGPL